MTKHPNILHKIIDNKRDIIQRQKDQVPLETLAATCQSLPACRDFVGAIKAKLSQQQPAVIAEIKKASPSKGIIRTDFDPAVHAKQYQKAGAACLSVLTDKAFFQGHDDHIMQAKQSCQLPILRKDFIIDDYQVYQTRAIGADCLLLIMACLDDQQYFSLNELAKTLGLSVLVESHNEQELQRALSVNPSLIGINNRDLTTFDTRLSTTEQLLPLIPDNAVIVTESGIHSHEDIHHMQRLGVHCFLVGEALMRAPDPGEALKKLLGE